MEWAWRVMTARTVATLVLAVAVVASKSFDPEGSSVMRGAGSVVVVVVVVGGRGSLKAWVAVLTSMRVEKAASRSLVRTWVKGGESIRSEVSSRRRRRGVGVGLLGGVVAVGGGEADMPDSCRTNSSSSRAGRR